MVKVYAIEVYVSVVCHPPSFRLATREGLEEVKETGKVGSSSRIALSLQDRQELRNGVGCQNWSCRTGPAGETEEDMASSSIVAVCSLVDESRLSPSLGFRADQYTLIRLSKVEKRKILKTLDTQIGTVNEVPNIEELSDGSWEICTLKSHCRTVHDTLEKIFPNSDVDLHYNPHEPTANDVKIWGYNAAKKLCRCRCAKRSIRIVKDGWPAAATYYASLLEVMCVLGEAATPLAPTYQGFLGSKGDAAHIRCGERDTALEEQLALSDGSKPICPKRQKRKAGRGMRAVI